MKLKLVSWNVNGIRAAVRNGLLDFIEKEGADIYAFQEIKADEFQLPLELAKDGYKMFINPAERKGYSGTMVLSRIGAVSSFTGFPSDNEDEGRILGLEFEKFWLLNIYFPNSQRGLTRLDYKLEFNNRILPFLRKLRKSKSLVICGDFNVAHEDIDIARPEDNRKNAGFTREEREWMSEFLNDGYVDTFRMFNREPDNYTWWTYRFNARSRNIGWRIDYFVVSEDMKERVVSSEILSDVMGSDHAPIRIVIDL